MRLAIAGCIFALLWAAASVAVAQAQGEVESIGFERRFRPNCWTPMVIKLRPESGEGGTFQIQVIQRDMDLDKVIFTRLITLTGSPEGQPPREQRFWMYFVPQPVNDGLFNPGDTLTDLQKRLRVYLCTASGRQLRELAIRDPLENVDPVTRAMGRVAIDHRSERLVLMISDGRGLYVPYDSGGPLRGILADVSMVSIKPAQLPDNAIGYEAVDAVVWLDADPAALDADTGQKRRALEQYIRDGGTLVVSQMHEWRKTQKAFGDWLPVTVSDLLDRATLEPLRRLSLPRSARGDTAAAPETENENKDSVKELTRDLTGTQRRLKAVESPVWDRPPGPFKMALAEAHPGAAVDVWIDWAGIAPTRYSPYIARRTFGTGNVTWVAQDLSDLAFTRVTAAGGWVNIWDRVFGWNNAPMMRDSRRSEDDPEWQAYLPATGVDLGGAILGGMDHGTKTALLVVLAMFFFVAYWLVAGPGVYFFLRRRKQSGWSWWAFAATALVATALTVGVVWVVLRGPPKVRHFTVVRGAPGMPTIVHSRIGLYIPRDGDQRVSLPDAAAGEPNYIRSFAIHPQFIRESRDLPARQEYIVPVGDSSSEQPVTVSFPYRSTLKKIETQWVGPTDVGIFGSGRLTDVATLEGSITNGTGRDLRAIHLGYHFPGTRLLRQADYVVYLPKWEAGVTLQLKEQTRILYRDPSGGSASRGEIPPAGDGRRIFWTDFWYRPFVTPSGGFSEDRMADDDWSQQTPRSLAMLSFYDRLPVMRSANERWDSRVEFHRRGGRYLDMSPAIASGSLVVIAQAEGPLPIPIKVQGKPVPGEGRILYQYALPLDRAGLDDPTGAGPASAPASRPRASSLR